MCPVLALELAGNEEASSIFILENCVVSSGETRLLQQCNPSFVKNYPGKPAV